MKLMICLGICLITLFLNGMIFSTAQQIQYSESVSISHLNSVSEDEIQEDDITLEYEDLSDLGDKLDTMCDKAAKLERSTMQTHEALKLLTSRGGLSVKR